MARRGSSFRSPATGEIDAERAYQAAVSIVISAGVISQPCEASKEASRFTETSYVLMGAKGGALRRIPRVEIVAELERQDRINGNLEQYHLRFRPGRTTVMVGLFGGFATLLFSHGWMNTINERRIAALEASYLEHQASVSGAGDRADLAAIETVHEFQSRVMRARLDGCYANVQANLARAAGSLKVAMNQRAAGGLAHDPKALANLQQADGSYQQYRAALEHCRNSLFGLFN